MNRQSMGETFGFDERPRLDRISVRGTPITAGSRVRLWPSGRGDILDMALEAKTATVESIEQDYEDRIFVAVTVDDDPGRDLGAARKVAHRFFFRPEELEPLG